MKMLAIMKHALRIIAWSLEKFEVHESNIIRLD
jgi:hypothetical protein